MISFEDDEHRRWGERGNHEHHRPPVSGVNHRVHTIGGFCATKEEDRRG